ncbi:diguanylate cyclase [Pseudomarimonas arenosa]|uniref:diguanylate cyclase n=1 Tax=Pseudomarimonas arenosa TaxID=2774145 RepID=A0AAW3ZGZ7_9GAMM|nr:diguanylate cyclase [Pseudomarimonas arenosa]MBD8525378.1 diguanylate cyclase [Pseudomarimonas arenosa]
MPHEPSESQPIAIADVLIVDDQPDNVVILAEALESADCRCRVATSGKRALAAVASKTPDVILLDILMPGLDGYEVCRQLKSKHETADIPVLFLSALDEPFDKLRAFEAGGADYVTKPFHIAEVRARVQVHVRLRRLQQALAESSLTDALTGLANRRRFEEVLAGEWGRAERRNDTLSLLMIDVDHFKCFNDHYGHVAGDDCLRRVGQSLQGALSRSADFVARYGGEEFVAVLAGLDPAECATQGERLRAAVEKQAIPHEASTAGPVVSISIGAATLRPNRNRSSIELVEAADAALYRAKAAGRNRVEASSAGGN